MKINKNVSEFFNLKIECDDETYSLNCKVFILM